MDGLITGFAVIASIIGVGYLLGWRGTLGEDGRQVLVRLTFHVATPALLFTTLADADLATIFSPALLATGVATVAVAAVFAVVGAVRRWGLGRTTIGALCASYVNAANLGIPVAVHVLDDTTLVAPLLLFQQLLLSPLALVLLDGSEPGSGKAPASWGARVWRTVTAPVRNPIVIGTLAGVAVAASGVTLPEAVMQPAGQLGAMAVPGVLIAFGVSLHGASRPLRGDDRWPVLLSVTLKSVVHPVVAWAVSAGIFRLDPTTQFQVVAVATLPAAQNLYTYAAHYDIATRLARESILISTVMTVPALTVVTLLLG
ncbi:AEC family transporter [Streptomyces sp. 4N509B]|uniref:AEC family transporter n=1 Tax=Streptomyces sp. 4N509B TaxID=3457413 RepID=UPI003FCF50CF